MIAAISAIGAYELLSATKIRKVSVIVYTIFAAVLVPFSIFLNSLIGGTTIMLISLLSAIVFLLLFLLVIEAVLALNKGGNTNRASVKNSSAKNSKSNKNNSDDSDKKLKFRQFPIVLAVGILIPLLLSSLISLRITWHNIGHFLILLPVIATIMTDSGAYFSGVAFGKKKPFPNISPNKTVEGFVGGFVIGILSMLIYGFILSAFTPFGIVFPALILYGALGAFMTMLGDLTFSLIKRKCGIKDYGRLLPGHGGALDRFDSLIFAAPTMLLLTILVPAIIAKPYYP